MAQVGDFSFSRKDRLLDAGAYKRVFDGVSHRASHKYLLFLAVPNDLQHHRLGLVISKKNVKLAVQRNRIKRIVRECFRNQPAAGPGMDVVMLARKGVDQLDNASLSIIVQQQWRRLTEDTTSCSK